MRSTESARDELPVRVAVLTAVRRLPAVDVPGHAPPAASQSEVSTRRNAWHRASVSQTKRFVFNQLLFYFLL